MSSWAHTELPAFKSQMLYSGRRTDVHTASYLTNKSILSH